MKSLRADDNADTKMIGGVVAILVTLILAVIVFFNIAGSVDLTTVDSNIASNLGENTTLSTRGSNSTDDTLDQAATFFTIAPIIAIVVVAVVILRYVGQI